MIIELIGAAVESIQDVNGIPYYSYGTWIDEANRLELLNDIISKQDEKFPLVYLLLYKGFKQNYIESENAFQTDLRIFILNRTKLVNNAQRRNEDEMQTLRDIETDFKTKLHNYLNYTDYSSEEFFYMENQLSTPVNSIELEIPARYELNCLT